MKLLKYKQVIPASTCKIDVQCLISVYSKITEAFLLNRKYEWTFIGNHFIPNTGTYTGPLAGIRFKGTWLLARHWGEQGFFIVDPYNIKAVVTKHEGETIFFVYK